MYTMLVPDLYVHIPTGISKFPLHVRKTTLGWRLLVQVEFLWV